MSHGYSDKINHALAFAAKYYVPRERRKVALSYLTHPAHMGVILARYGCDEETIISGILLPVLSEAPGEAQHALRHKIADKFGSAVISTVTDGCEPRYDDLNHARPWHSVKLEFLGQLRRARNPGLDVCAASEIHLSGSLIADVRRLGPEYLPAVSTASGDEILWWYRSLIETLDARPDWSNRRMLQELRLHAADLARQLKNGSE